MSRYKKPPKEEPPQPSQPLLLTMPQVAERLQLSPSKAYAMAARGEIPTVKIGRLVRVRAATLEKWIAEREQAQQEEQERIRAQVSGIWRVR